MSRFRYLQVDDGGVIVDDGFVPRTDVVEVLEDAAQHQAGDVIDAQMQSGPGKRLEDAPDGFINHVIYALDQAVDEGSMVVAALIALGKTQIGLSNRLAQVLEQEVGDGIGGGGQIDIAHHERVLLPVVIDSLADLGPVAIEHTSGYRGNAVGKNLAGAFTEVGLRRQTEERASVELHLATGGIAGCHTPLARVTDCRSGRNLDHRLLSIACLADVADVQMPREHDMHPGIDKATAHLARFIDHIGGGQRVLHVEMGHQMMMHHGDDMAT